jgi:hypothetical protein
MNMSFNKWILERYEEFCNVKCLVNTRLVSVSDDECAKILETYCKNCNLAKFVFSLTE